jgi:hypothetical protein
MSTGGGHNGRNHPGLDVLGLADKAGALDYQLQPIAANFPNNCAARIEQVNGKDDLILTGLDKLDEPESLIALRKEVRRRMPRACQRVCLRSPPVRDLPTISRISASAIQGHRVL